MQDKGFVVSALLLVAASFVSDSASALDCSSKPCKNTSMCKNSDMFGYICICIGRFRGRNCEINERILFSLGPSTEGTSKVTTTSPSTTTDAVNCAYAPCLNSGSCSDSPLGGYLCHCPVGITGVNCEIKLETTDSAGQTTSPSTTTDTVNCASAPCLHSGSCSDSLLGGYLCHCPFGFTGVKCEIKLETTDSAGQTTSPSTTTDAVNCAYAPCLNSGACSDSPLGGYFCHCPVGITGVNCEIKLETTDSAGETTSPSTTTDAVNCAYAPCLNSGLCSDSPLGGYLCHCPVGITGVNCEIKLTTYCGHYTPCQNGGTCTDRARGSDYQCKCPIGYKGKDCQYLAEQPEETKEIVLSDEWCERKVSVGIPEVKYMATLSCEEGTILIKSVAYGSGTHWSAWIEQIGKLCNHESHCKVTAKDDMLDDPLMRIYKRLIIVYECETITARSSTSSDDDDE